MLFGIALMLSLFLVVLFFMPIEGEQNIKLTPVNNNVLVYGNVTLTCMVQNEYLPVCNVVWYRNNHKIPDSEFFSIECNSTRLIINQVTGFNQGMYKCEVCFDCVNMNCTFSNVANVAVSSNPESPRCTKIDSGVKEGEIIEFKCCPYGANVATSLEVFVLFPNNTRQHLLTSHPTLNDTINVRQKLYYALNKAVLYCTANFSFPEMTLNCTSSTLNVSYSPTIISTTITYTIANSYDEKRNVTILMIITSNPDAIVTWLSYEDNMTQSISSKSYTGDDKLYKCVITCVTNGTTLYIRAENNIGTTNKTLILCWNSEPRRYNSTLSTAATTIPPTPQYDVMAKMIKNISLSFCLLVVVVIFILMMIWVRQRQRNNWKNRRQSIRLDIQDEFGSTLYSATTQNTTQENIYQTHPGNQVENVAHSSEDRPNTTQNRPTLFDSVEEEEQDSQFCEASFSIDTGANDILPNKKKLAEIKKLNAESLIYLDIDHSGFESDRNKRSLHVIQTTENVEYAEVGLR